MNLFEQTACWAVRWYEASDTPNPFFMKFFNTRDQARAHKAFLKRIGIKKPKMYHIDFVEGPTGFSFDGELSR